MNDALVWARNRAAVAVRRTPTPGSLEHARQRVRAATARAPQQRVVVARCRRTHDPVVGKTLTPARMALLLRMLTSPAYDQRKLLDRLHDAGYTLTVKGDRS